MASFISGCGRPKKEWGVGDAFALIWHARCRIPKAVNACECVVVPPAPPRSRPILELDDVKYTTAAGECAGHALGEVLVRPTVGKASNLSVARAAGNAWLLRFEPCGRANAGHAPLKRPQQINFVKCRKKELVPNLARSADGEQVMGGGLAAEAPAEEGLGRASVDLVMEL